MYISPQLIWLLCALPEVYGTGNWVLEPAQRVEGLVNASYGFRNLNAWARFDGMMKRASCPIGEVLCSK